MPFTAAAPTLLMISVLRFDKASKPSSKAIATGLIGLSPGFGQTFLTRSHLDVLLVVLHIPPSIPPALPIFVRCRLCRIITRRPLTTSGTSPERAKESGAAKIKAKATTMDKKVAPTIRQRNRNKVVVEEGAVVVGRAELAVAVAALATPLPLNDPRIFGVATRLGGRVGDGAAEAS
jgi:hypothetical protein